MTPSPTKEAIERLRAELRYAIERGADLYMEDLATLLASHDKLVEGLEAARDALYAAWERTGYADDLAAYHLADLAVQELGQ